MMTALRFRDCLGVACVVALIALAAPHAVAQASASSYGGTTVFRFLMGPNLLKLRPLSTLQDLDDDPAQKLLVVFGDTAPLEQWGPSKLMSFLNRGGALLVATDHQSGQCLHQTFGASVTGNHLRAVDPAGKYLGKLDDCPVVEQAPGHPELFKRVGSLVTNLPSEFQMRSGPLSFLTGQEVVGRLPRTTNWRRRVVSHRPCVLTYHWGRPGCRALLLSDQDVFIDGMMFQTQNDNFVFAYNALQWLTNGRQRTEVLFFDNGQAVTDFNVPLKWSPPPALPPPVAIADHLLAGLEQENAFNRLLTSLLPHRAILGLAAMLVCVAVVGRWLYLLLTRRVRVEGDLALAAATSDLPARLRPLMKQRHQAMLQAGNLWEAAHDLARHCFEDQILPPQPSDAGSTIKRPSLVAAGPPWRTWSLRRRARLIWQLAYGAGPRVVTRREFQRLVAWSEEIQTALADGRLRLTWSTSPHGRNHKA